MYVSTVTLFQAISGFKNPVNKSGWDGSNCQTSNFL